MTIVGDPLRGALQVGLNQNPLGSKLASLASPKPIPRSLQAHWFSYRTQTFHQTDLQLPEDFPERVDNWYEEYPEPKHRHYPGYLAIALDASVSALKVKEACQSGAEEECRVVSYREGGRFAGSVAGGSGGTLLAVGCGVAAVSTAGVGGLACAIIAAGVGSYVGGKYGGQFGAEGGDIIREIIHD